jgi:predicted HTH transcriptional regulator
MSEDMYFWHALPKQWETMSYEDFITNRRKLIAKVIRTGFERLSKLSEEEGEKLLNNDIDIVKLIELGESDTLEFKSSMINPTQTIEQQQLLEKQLAESIESKDKTKTENLKKALDSLKASQRQALEVEVIKTIAAFMNTRGGTLLIGVADNGKISGIEHDYTVFSDRRTYDGWIQHLKTLIKNHLGNDIMMHIQMARASYENKTIAIVRVNKSPKPVFMEYSLKGQNRSDLFIRALNTTEALNPRQYSDYFKNWDS